jgi:hypothetical protein
LAQHRMNKKKRLGLLLRNSWNKQKPRPQPWLVLVEVCGRAAL